LTRQPQSEAMKIKTLIVDDEPLARERVRSLLVKEPDVEIVAECANGEEAVAAVRQHAPELLFLDVQMPGLTGFEVLEALGAERLPIVIFVTAYDQHALKAFEVHALDYLLKPFKQARFRQAVQRAREQIENKQAGAASQRLLEMLSSRQPEKGRLTRLVVKENDRVLFVRTEQIDYIESAGNYLVVHVGKQSHVIRETLTALEGQLAPEKFLRISRSAIVNVERIKELQPLFNGEHIVVLHDGKRLPMTRGLREVQEVLKFA
jgi:two-component system LytT family response regulator